MHVPEARKRSAAFVSRAPPKAGWTVAGLVVPWYNPSDRKGYSGNGLGDIAGEMSESDLL